MSFTNRDLVLGVGAVGLSRAGDLAVLTALGLRVQSHGGAVWAVAALLAAGLVPLVVCAPLAGRIADRVDSRRVLVTTALSAAACCVALARVDSLGATIALVGLLGMADAVLVAAWQGLLPDLAGPGGVTRALAASQAASSIAVVAGPALGGALTGIAGAWLVLLADAASFAVLAVIAAMLRTRRVAATSTDSRGGFALIVRDPVLRGVVGALAFAILLACAVNVAEVFYVREDLHADALTYGLLIGCWGAGSLVGATGAGRLRLAQGMPMVAARATLGLSVCIVGLGLSPTVWCYAAVSLVGGSLNGVLSVAVSSTIVSRTDATARGRAFAAVSGCQAAAQLMAYALAAGLGAVLSPQQIIVWAGVLSALAPLGLIAWLRTRRAVQGHVSHAGLHARGATAAPGSARPSVTG